MVFYAHDRAFACELGAIQSILPDPTLGIRAKLAAGIVFND